jgi:CHAD domain-containing protein
MDARNGRERVNKWNCSSPSSEVKYRYASHEQLVRTLRAQLAMARHLLKTRAVPPDRSIHAARKCLKRSRAVLRLLRPSLGERRYHVANRTLRDAAAPLSAVRDARVLLDTLKALRRHLPRTARAAASGLWGVFEQERRDARRAWSGRDFRLTASYRALNTLARGTQRWPKDSSDPRAACTAVVHTYRKMCSAFALVRRRPTDLNLHEWRKQTKYLLYELQVLCPRKNKYLIKLNHGSCQLAKHLGDDHDLAVLRRRACQNLHLLGPVGVQRAFIDEIDYRRARLQSTSWVEGKRVCAQKPHQLTIRFRRDSTHD